MPELKTLTKRNSMGNTTLLKTLESPGFRQNYRFSVLSASNVSSVSVPAPLRTGGGGLVDIKQARNSTGVGHKNLQPSRLQLWAVKAAAKLLSCGLHSVCPAWQPQACVPGGRKLVWAHT